MECIADDETHPFVAPLMDEGGAMLWGRVNCEMMENYWPAAARTDPRFFALLAGAAFALAAGGTVFLAAPLALVGAAFGAAFAVAALTAAFPFCAVPAVVAFPPKSRPKYFPVTDAGFFAISSGVPCAISWPPPGPPSGPRSS